MSTLDIEQLNRPIKDLRRVTILFAVGFSSEYQVLAEAVPTMKEQCFTTLIYPTVSSIKVAKPLGFDAEGKFHWDEKNEECICPSPENQRKLAEEIKNTRSRYGHA